jgi:hypothetical protein
MKRLAWMLILGLLVPASAGLAYDGPGAPVTYDKTINAIKVVMTSQPVLLSGGRARFTMTAFVPIEADTLNRPIRLEIRRFTSTTPTSFVVLDSCDTSVSSIPSGGVAELSCAAEIFATVLTPPAPTTVGIYPYVFRPASTPLAELTHDGRDFRLTIPVAGDDTYEENDDLVTASNLGTPTAPVNIADLPWLDNDFYKFTVPPGGGFADIRIEFWNNSADLDLWLYDASGEPIGASLSSTDDFERIPLTVLAGETYYIGVEPGIDVQPTYYNLLITITPPDIVTITKAPSGVPNPVGALGTAAFSVEAADSLGHPLTYFWTQTCSTDLEGVGTFSDRTVRTPTWTAPNNTKPTARPCTIRVTATDPNGVDATASFVQLVGPAGDAVTITSGPTSTQNPVVPPNSTSLDVIAIDTLGHVLSYAWTATCPWSTGGTGTFSNANIQSPSWVPPANKTGVQQTCTLTVNVTDNQGQNATAGIAQRVDPSPHTLTLTAGPAGVPSTVASSGNVAVSVTAVDSYDHPLSYLWTATCIGGLANGAFTNGATATPTWTAPANLTGNPQTCTISVTVNDGQGKTANGSYTQTVSPLPHTVTIQTQPAGSPNPVVSAKVVSLSVVAVDSYSHALSYAWNATCPTLASNGTFSASNVQNPNWTAPLNLTGATHTCTISVVASDGLGQSASAQFAQQVLTAPHEITFPAGPAGSPNPVASSGTASLSAAAADSFLHPVTYSWASLCPAELSGPGTFNPSNAVQNPTWTAPANLTGTTKTCAITVTASDGSISGTATYQQQVASLTHTLIITGSPTGAPNPVDSGAQANLSVTAADSLNHPVSYQWTALCPALGNNGSFSDANAQNPTWTAPSNLTGNTQTCSISVVASDGQGLTAADSYQQQVASVTHTLTITAGPSGSPNPTGSGSPAALSVTAVDSLNHPLSFLWLAECPALGGQTGTFSPGPTVANPTWTAPTNLTGAEQACTISVTVNDNQGEVRSGTYSQGVASVAHTLTLTVPPSGVPNPVVSGGAVAVTAAAVDSLNHALNYQWSATCAGGMGGGSFNPSAASPAPAWIAPVNTTGDPQTCEIGVVIDDGHGESVNGSFMQGVQPAAHTLTITVPPAGTPNPVASGANVVVAATIVDSYGHALNYAWHAACPGLPNNGTFVPDASAASPTWKAPTNFSNVAEVCTITLTVDDGLDKTVTAFYTQTVNAAVHSLTLTAPASGTPNPSAPGVPVPLTVGVVDTFEHTLSYLWQATCAEVVGTGTFSPSASAAAPTWTPPSNNNADLNCLIRVTVIDTLGLSVNSSYVQKVSPSAVPHTLTFSAPPAGNPSTVPSGGIAAMTASAVDSLGHPISYAWSATCPGLSGPGTFAPSSSAQNPSWTAPPNGSGTTQPCTIQVNASDGQGLSDTATFTQNVASTTHAVTISAGPSGAPNPSAPGATVSLSVTAVDSLGHALTYGWQATCAGVAGSGTFSPNAASPSPSWTPPAHPDNAAFSCTITVEASDGQGQSASGFYAQNINAGTPPAHTLTITSGPGGVPNPVAAAGQVAVTVSATDSLNHTLTYAWTASCPALSNGGAFTPSASVRTPTWTAPGNATGASQPCSLSVTVSDGQGEQQSASYEQIVNPTAHSLTVTAQPTGTPNPSSPNAPVALKVGIVDSYDHALTYLWQATCAEAPGSGTFSPNSSAAAPIWTPPSMTGDTLTCLVRVTVIDNQGLSANASFTHTVNSGAPTHTITFTTAPTGSPNPVASGGTATLNTAALDSLGHPLTYQWTASCPGLIGTGSFSPSASAQAPSWTAPANTTGSTRTCTLQVVARDTEGESATASYAQNVSSAQHAITITAGPSGSPNPSTPGSPVALSVSAVDSLGHGVSYAWQATCPGVAGTGTFAPSASSQAPSWTPPINPTGAAFSCTLRVDVADGLGVSANAAFSQAISAGTPAHNVTITAGPTAAPDPVASGGATLLSVTAIDTLGHTLSYAWSAFCANLAGNGSFNPSAASPSPTWTAPANNTGASESCTLTVTASDGQGKFATGTTSVRVNSSAVTHNLTITNGPFGIANPSAPGAPVALSVTAVDTLGHALSYLWQASCAEVGGTGTFVPSNTVATPTWTPPSNPGGDLNCLVRVTVIDGLGKSADGSYLQKVNGSTTPPHSLTITTSPNGTPNPVSSAGTTALGVAATDSLGHALTYQWTAACPGLNGNGTFLPSAAVQSPSWTAPPNLTGSEQSCTMKVDVADAFGEAVSASYAQRVSSVPHTLTLTAGPTGAPNPVAPGGSATLSLTAQDSLNHTLSYLWSASCPAGGNGTFTPSATVASPTWTPPAGQDGSFACLIQVIVDDGSGKSVQGSYIHNVNTGPPPTHTVTFTVPPSGTPNPVAAAGAVALTTTASDSLGHALVYTWSATCATLPNNGSFTPSATGQSTTWVAPSNTTGTSQPCTVLVTADDGQGQTATVSFIQTVNTVPGNHTLTIQTQPAGTPNPVPSGQAVALSVGAVDSEGHTLSYLWQSVCGSGVTNGTFSNQTAPSPTWTAPANPTGSDVSCLITVLVADGFGLTQKPSVLQTVQTVPHTLTIQTAPSGAPNPVESGGGVGITFKAVDSWLHALSHKWTATCPGLTSTGSFSPSDTAAEVSWTAPGNYTGVQRSCTIKVDVTDGQGKSETASYAQLIDPGLVPITVVATNWVGDPLEYPTGSPTPSLLARPNYAVVLYRADGVTQVHAIDVFAMNGLVEWPVETLFASGEAAVLKIWRTDTSGYSPSWDTASPLPAWKSNPLKQQVASVNITITEDTTYTVRALVDTDSDGMDDFWELRYGLDPTFPGDSTLDPDVDTLTNRDEFQKGTNPYSADTDGDGVNDNVEAANGDNPADASDWTPPALRATPGDKAVYLSWNGVLKADSAVITVSRMNGTLETPLGTIAVADIKTDRLRVLTLPGTPGGPLVNGDVYRFGLRLTRKAVTRQPATSELVSAKPGALALAPRYPTVFLHGFGGRGDAEGSFADSLHFAANTLGWTFGGRFCFPGIGLTPAVDTSFAGTTVRTTNAAGLGPAENAVCAGLGTTPSGSGQFFTVDFGNNFGKYGSDQGGGLFHQAKEVERLVDALAAAGVTNATGVALAGHGTGALAARKYLQTSQNGDGRVAEFISYGAPHLGADTAYWCAASGNPSVSGLGGVFGQVLTALTASGACANPAGVGGVRDTLFTCVDDQVSLNPFLADDTSVPNTVLYTSVASAWRAVPWDAMVLPGSGRRSADCLGADWDGLAPSLSQDFNNTGLLLDAARTLPSERFAASEGHNIASVFCGLEAKCLVVQATAGVEISVADPLGRTVSRQVTEIPGAGFETPYVEESDLQTVVIPFVTTGTYTVTVTGKSGVSPSARFTLTALRESGLTVLANNVRIQDIPVAGYPITGVVGR